MAVVKNQFSFLKSQDGTSYVLYINNEPVLYDIADISIEHTSAINEDGERVHTFVYHDDRLAECIQQYIANLQGND